MVKKRLWKGRLSLSKGERARRVTKSSGIGWTGTSKMWDLGEGGKGRERFTLWSPFWSLAWPLVALQARAVCQHLCTVTHLLGSLNTEGELMLLWAARTNPSFVCSFYLDSVRRIWHFWLFSGLSCCKHHCSGGGGDGGSWLTAHWTLLWSSFPSPRTAIHL